LTSSVAFIKQKCELWLPKNAASFSHLAWMQRIFDHMMQIAKMYGAGFPANNKKSKLDNLT
jgi:hypothetical protein